MLKAIFKRSPQTDRRQNRRNYDQQLKIKVEGKTYKTLDWSLGGFRIKGYHRPLQIGERIAGKVGVPHGARTGNIVIEIMRATNDGEFGVRFLEITPSSFVAMANLKAC